MAYSKLFTTTLSFLESNGVDLGTHKNSEVSPAGYGQVILVNAGKKETEGEAGFEDHLNKQLKAAYRGIGLGINPVDAVGSAIRLELYITKKLSEKLSADQLVCDAAAEVVCETGFFQEREDTGRWFQYS